MDEKAGKILKGAFELFNKYGIKSISMDDICQELGISKKTLYQYYKNKEDLLEKGLLIENELINSTLSDIKLRAENAIDALLQVSLTINKHFVKPNLIFRRDLQKFYPELFKTQLGGRREHILQKIKENLVTGIQEGLYREDLMIDLVAQLYVQRLADMFNTDFLSNENLTFEKVFEVMFENHIRGISNQKGIEYFEKKKESLKL